MISPSLQEQVKYEFVRYSRGYGLDVGFGPGKAFPHFAAVRLVDDEECVKQGVREIAVERLTELAEIRDESCDFIVVANVLTKTIDTPDFAIENWLRCIKNGGHLCIYEPEKFGRDDFLKALPLESITVLRLEEWPAGGHFMVVRKDPGLPRNIFMPPKPPRTVCVVRHGGFGDQIQAAALFPELVRQGFHITVLTTESGKDIIAHDPHVDDWYLIDRNQVPNVELAWFWKITSRHYDRFINLNESVEGTFLAMPGRVQHGWPHVVRHARLNVNYAEHAAAIAEVPFKPEGKFYATVAERLAATAHLDNIRSAMNEKVAMLERDLPVFNIMWVLSGSSPHKYTPHQDVVIHAILQRLQRASITLVGALECKILEAGLEALPRVFCRSGELSIRETLAMAQQMDLVIGPETGVMNAVAFEPLKKIVMLSHSSYENLTKHWINTVAIPGKSHCYPCHQLHYTAEFCPREPVSGAALCQAGVIPEDIYAPIDEEYTGWARVQLLRSA